jgi:hypothetical protein
VLALRSSAIMCAAAATCAGGLVGNLVSAMTHGGRIPDPFLLGGAIAFNPADVFFVLGLSGLVCASIQRVATSTAWLFRWRGGIRNELTTLRNLGRVHRRARGDTRRRSRGFREVGASRDASAPRASRPMIGAQEGRLDAASTPAEATTGTSGFGRMAALSTGQVVSPTDADCRARCRTVSGRHLDKPND